MAKRYSNIPTNRTNSNGSYWANKKRNEAKLATMPKKEWKRLSNPSQYQLDIFENIKNDSGHTVVAALAGSGKTSTIIESLYHIPAGKSFVLVAFNKAIADELRERIPPNANGDVGTSHSHSFRAVKNAFGNVKLDKYKVQNFAESLFGKEPEQTDLIVQLCKTVGLCKAFLYGQDNINQIDTMIDDFGIETEFAEVKFDRKVFITAVLGIMDLCKSQTSVIDFDDMLWFTAVYDLKMTQYDYVFVDECQDQSALTMCLVKKMVKPDGRIIAVGDRNQAIYAFRGADKNSMDNIINGLGAKVLPLSVTYRCAKAIVREANVQVPELMAYEGAEEGAEEGTVESCSFEEMLKKVQPSDFIISRTNAPMIGICMKLIKQGKPANIQGRDIGSNLLFFVKKSKCSNVDSFIEYVHTWRDKEVERIEKKKGNSDPIVDKAECLLALADGAQSIQDITDAINRLFEDVADDGKILLSSCHKIKGKEANRAFLLMPTFRPGKDPQEDNLVYVAKTRAKKSLVYVESLKIEQGEY